MGMGVTRRSDRPLRCADPSVTDRSLARSEYLVARPACGGVVTSPRYAGGLRGLRGPGGLGGLEGAPAPAPAPAPASPCAVFARAFAPVRARERWPRETRTVTGSPEPRAVARANASNDSDRLSDRELACNPSPVDDAGNRRELLAQSERSGPPPGRLDPTGSDRIRLDRVEGCEESVTVTVTVSVSVSVSGAPRIPHSAFRSAGP
jgi:hypothetical protein